MSATEFKRRDFLKVGAPLGGGLLILLAGSRGNTAGPGSQWARSPA